MSKFTDFYAKAATDENAKTKLSGILGSKAINEADDEQLKKIGILAKELGFEITVDEAKKYLNNDNAELDDDDLEAVAGGGKGDVNIDCSGVGSVGNPSGGGSPTTNPSTTYSS